MQTKKSVEFFKSIPTKHCSECGEHVYEQACKNDRYDSDHYIDFAIGTKAVGHFYI